MKKPLFTICISLILIIGIWSCGETTKETTSTLADSSTLAETTSPPASTRFSSSASILQNLTGAADFSSFTSAVSAAGLTESWNAAGPFTIFAPTNEAFNAIPTATLSALMDPLNKANLASVLNYHVVSGNVKSADLKNGDKLKSVNGSELNVKVLDGRIWINEAALIIADNSSSNGTFHTVNKVMIP